MADARHPKNKTKSLQTKRFPVYFSVPKAKTEAEFDPAPQNEA